MKKPVITLERIYESLENLYIELTKRPTREELQYQFSKYYTKNELDEKFTQLKSDFFDKIDPVIREIEDNRVHREISTKDTQEIKEILEDHEIRIKKFEQH